MNGSELDPATIGTGIGAAAAAAGTVFTVLRHALAKWSKAQKEERAAEVKRAAEERSEYHNVVKAELRKVVGPLRRRLAHLEGTVTAILRGAQMEKPQHRKPRSRR